MALNDPEHLGTQILIQMAQPVYQEKLEKLDYTVPRGRHAKSINGVAIEDIMHEIRRHAAAAHTVVAFWIKQPQEEWPDHFKKLITELHNDGHIIISPHRKSFNVVDIVSALIEIKYEKEMDEFGLVQHIEDDFRKTYFSSFAPLHREKLIENIGDNVQIRPKSGVWITKIGQGVYLQESGEVLLQAFHEGELAGFFLQLAEDIADGL